MLRVLLLANICPSDCISDDDSDCLPDKSPRNNSSVKTLLLGNDLNIVPAKYNDLLSLTLNLIM